LLLDATGRLQRAPVIKGELVNSVGAGDSTVAGFVEGYLRGIEAGDDEQAIYDKAYKLAQACGSATAFSPWLAPKRHGQLNESRWHPSVWHNRWNGLLHGINCLSK